MNNLLQASESEEVILGPYAPIADDVVMNDTGVPIELIQTSLDDDERWSRARNGRGTLYRPMTERT